jgi:hypothetical protein
VKPFPDGPGRYAVSKGGGVFPEWSRDSKELLFRSGDQIVSAEIRTKGTTFETAAPKRLFDAGISTGLSQEFCISPDGKRLLMGHASGQDRVTVILNLAKELGRLEKGR